MVNRFKILSFSQRGFSLIEVILALGIFLITVFAMVGLLGPTLASVDDVEKTDEVVSVVNSVNAFLQSSPDIGTNVIPRVSTFEAIYRSISPLDGGDNFATIFVFRQYFDEGTGNSDADSTAVRVQIGFDSRDTAINAQGQINSFTNAAGPIYRVVLSASPVIPEEVPDPSNPGNVIQYRSPDRDAATGVYQLQQPLANYLEGYFAMEVRIYAETPPPPGPGAPAFNTNVPLTDLVDREPIFTYNTAILR